MSYEDDGEERGVPPPAENDRGRRKSSRSWSHSPPRRGRSRSRSRSPPRRHHRSRSRSPRYYRDRDDRYRRPPPPRDYRYGPPDDYYRYPPPPPHHYPPPPPPHHDPYFRGPPPPPARGGSAGGGRRRRDEGPPGVSLLVRNVAPDATAGELHAAFSRLGEVRDVYIPRDYHSQNPKGFAFVEFANGEQAREARDEMDRFVIKGRELEVVFAQERRKTPDEMRGRVVNTNNAPTRQRSSSFERHRQRERDDDRHHRREED